MRIIGGANRGRTVRVPAGVRPSGGRLREALFSMLGRRIDGAALLDLYAGSGAVGLEAISRGARCAVFVERRGRALSVLSANVDRLGEGRARIVVGTIPECLKRRLEKERYDIAFADPPYDWQEWRVLVEQAMLFVAPGGILVLEHSVRSELELGDLAALRQDSRMYGESCLTILGRGPRIEPETLAR